MKENVSFFLCLIVGALLGFSDLDIIESIIIGIFFVFLLEIWENSTGNKGD
jgi:hypothetical protein